MGRSYSTFLGLVRRPSDSRLDASSPIRSRRAPSLLAPADGAEGHAGSAIQLAALQRLASGTLSLGAQTTVLFVHALNPFGFAHGRRFNERNVDLNRNALFPDVDAFAGAFVRLQSDPRHVDGYERIASMLNDASGWRYPVLANARFAFNLVSALLNPFGVGYVGLKRCVVAGQYHDARGLYYGGVELEASHAVLIRALRAEHAAHRRVIFVDVHSGLGPPGVDTLLTTTASRGAVRAIFGAPGGSGAPNPDDRFLSAAPNAAGAGSAAAAGYDLTEGTTQTYLPAMRAAAMQRERARGGAGAGWEHALHVTQEFGTLPGILVVRAMVREAATWQKLRCGALDGSAAAAAATLHAVALDAARAGAPATRGLATERGAAAVRAAQQRADARAKRVRCADAATALRAAFFVQSDEWMAAVARRGLRVVEQALAALERAGEAGEALLPQCTAESLSF